MKESHDVSLLAASSKSFPVSNIPRQSVFHRQL